MSTNTESTKSRSAKSELKDQARTIVDDVRELGAIGSAAAQEGVDAATQRLRQAKGDAVDRVQNYEEELIQYVRAQPLKSVLIAAGVGALASMWLRRS